MRHPTGRRERLSIVLPVYNETENVERCLDEIVSVMRAEGLDYEIVFVDDGSTDGTTEQLIGFATREDCTVVLLRRNYGQTAAMHAGIQHASGDVIVTMDSDLQNDPRDIPELVRALDGGFDLAFGWRHRRQDKFLSRRLPSLLANRLISRVTGFPIHDLGCTLKAMRADIAKELELYGEMHRFIPILAANHGARCTEVRVNHRARTHGTSKYGIGRWIRVLLDLVTIQYMSRYFASPMKLFGLIGFGCAVISMLSLSATVIMKLAAGVDMTGNPLTYLAVLATIVSLQFFSLGLFGELAVRIYYSQGTRTNYHVRRVLSATVPAPELATEIRTVPEPAAAGRPAPAPAPVPAPALARPSAAARAEPAVPVT